MPLGGVALLGLIALDTEVLASRVAVRRIREAALGNRARARRLVGANGVLRTPMAGLCARGRSTQGGRNGGGEGEKERPNERSGHALWRRGREDALGQGMPRKPRAPRRLREPASSRSHPRTQWLGHRSADLEGRLHDDADDIAWEYDGRAGLEPLIAELKGALGLGHRSSRHFAANRAAMRVLMLAQNLILNWVDAEHPPLRKRRLPWLRRALIRVPGRQRSTDLPPPSALARQLDCRDYSVRMAWGSGGMCAQIPPPVDSAPARLAMWSRKMTGARPAR